MHFESRSGAWNMQPLVISIFLLATNTGLLINDPSSLISLLLLLVGYVVGAYFLWKGIGSMKKGQLLCGIVFLFSLVILIFGLGVPTVGHGFTDLVASRVKLELNETDYLVEVQLQSSNTFGFKYKEFSWGGFMSNPVTLIYDESDELNLPPSSRSATWWKAQENSEFSICRYEISHIKTHFYLVRFGC